MLLDEFTRLLESLLLAGSLLTLVLLLVLTLLSDDVLLTLLLGSLVVVEPESTLPVLFVGSFVALEPLLTLESVGSFVALEPFVSILEALLFGFALMVVPSLAILDGLSGVLFVVLLSDEPEATLPVVAAVDGALLTDEPPLLSLPLVIMRPLPAPLPYPPIEPWCP